MGEGGGEMHKTHSVLWATVNDINHTSSSATLKNKCGEIHCLSYCQQKKYQSQTILFHWCRSLSNMYREKLMRINKVHNHNNHSHTFIDRFCIKLNLMRSHLWSMEINFFLKKTRVVIFITTTFVHFSFPGTSSWLSSRTQRGESPSRSELLMSIGGSDWKLTLSHVLQ